ncbi:MULTISPECIES: MptD family putative ECF transporter S component [unclassified Treponema]|uniref:MptD family putative ECF transporter S component n=1 Tax=unclassified Treponema TaxID=2638727 RepID=UPI0020A367A3|nr:MULTISPECIES: MptD family putative ECF transporter S component [unclassified Treponema]UTC66838.1 MptD family putative ECF transporter S component [Treponema sp. OMZ 789]UTC69569.1 MptD family putative ECF transporter S component [Treponema sp. OMZ 790]UTC72283.1 MptD family putative ECF transporter S component [Treponema sp. OMZ 791]
MNNRLVLKDLINIGIFAVIYFSGLFIIGTPLVFLVITYLAYPFLVSLFLGIAVMFLLAKVQKPFGVFIFAVIPGCLMTLMGHASIVAIHNLIIAASAEIVRKVFGYNTVKGSIASYSVMSLWLCGGFWQIFLFKEQYFTVTEKMLGADYVREITSLPIWIMPILYATAFLGGLLGGLLGKKILKKHFERTGLL